MDGLIAWYAIVVGGVMVVWWGLEIRGGALGRGDRTAAEIGLHLAAELLTAAILVIGGIVLLTTGTTGVVSVGLGMLLYTVIQSPGYFAARREYPPVVMFGVLAGLTIAALTVLLLGR